MTTAKLLRTLVESPADPAGYDALMMAAAGTDQACAIRAAARACVLVPQSRRVRKNLIVLLNKAQDWDRVHAAVPRRYRPLPPRAHHRVDLDAAVSRYDWLLDRMERRRWEGWTPSRVEDSKFRFPLDRERLAMFRRSEVSGGNQTVPDRPEDFPPLDFSRFYPDYTDDERAHWGATLYQLALGLLSRLYYRGAAGIDWFDAAIRDDDRFGARVVQVPKFGTVTAKSLQSAYYACRVASLVPRNGVVLEIGGGFGALASRLLAIRPDITYVLSDLPVNMVLTHTHLTSLYGGAVAGLWEDGDLPSPGSRVLVVPPWRLPHLALKVDVAVNTMSFQHMDERNHLFYGAALRALGTRVLYHVNRELRRTDPAHETMIVPASSYSFMQDFEVVDSCDLDVKWLEVIARAKPRD